MENHKYGNTVIWNSKSILTAIYDYLMDGLCLNGKPASQTLWICESTDKCDHMYASGMRHTSYVSYVQCSLLLMFWFVFNIYSKLLYRLSIILVMILWASLIWQCTASTYSRSRLDPFCSSVQTVIIHDKAHAADYSIFYLRQCLRMCKASGVVSQTSMLYGQINVSCRARIPITASRIT